MFSKLTTKEPLLLDLEILGGKMKDNCSLLVTLPSLNNKDKILEIFKNPLISAVRFNTGVVSQIPMESALKVLKGLADENHKTLWIDLKGRQLRITKWADPLYEAIELNHEISAQLPAKIVLRGEEPVNITRIDKNKIYVYPIPRHAVGAGQSVNIISPTLKIFGYLTEKDKEVLTICKKEGIFNVMASFVEEESDLDEIRQFLPLASIVCKIESLKGAKFVLNSFGKSLMAARDDLFVECENSYEILKMLELIVSKDPSSICASRIFSSLEKSDKVSLADFCDLELMYKMGYRNFMFCDNICNYSLPKALEAWQEFTEKNKTTIFENLVSSPKIEINEETVKTEPIKICKKNLEKGDSK